jgi:hypothetical protein
MKQIIHIGGNKTASTLLQRELFAVHPAISYLGEDCADYVKVKDDIQALIHEDDSFYDERRAREMFDRYLQNSGKSVMIFSNEDIMTTLHPSVCAARLKALMPDARIVMVVRNQLTTWPSWYVNHGAYLKLVPRRYWRRYVALTEWLEYCFLFPRLTPVEAMNYERYFRVFSRFFGAANVQVLIYEELQANPQEYFARWAALLGLPPQEIAAHVAGKRQRPRNTQRRMLFHRWASYVPIMYRPVESLLGSWLDRGRPATIEVPGEWKDRIRDYYAGGNRKLASAAKLDLQAYGYPF